MSVQSGYNSQNTRIHIGLHEYKTLPIHLRNHPCARRGFSTIFIRCTMPYCWVFIVWLPFAQKSFNDSIQLHNPEPWPVCFFIRNNVGIQGNCRKNVPVQKPTDSSNGIVSLPIYHSTFNKLKAIGFQHMTYIVECIAFGAIEFELKHNVLVLCGIPSSRYRKQQWDIKVFAKASRHSRDAVQHLLHGCYLQRIVLSNIFFSIYPKLSYDVPKE